MRKKYPDLGVAAVAIAYSSIIAAFSVSPWFSWFNNALSDLGNTSNPANVSSGASWLFDIGLISSGSLAALFTLLLSKDERFSWKYIACTIPLLISSIGLAMIGIFNESFRSIHLVVSVIFFFFTALALLIYSYLSFPSVPRRLGQLL